jgi:pilus assembly protein CpaE
MYSVVRPSDIAAPGDHVPSSSILLLETDAKAEEAISAVLTGVGYAVTIVKDPAEAVRTAADYSLVVIDVTGPGATPADVCREIRATPSLSAIPVMCLTQSDDVEDRILFLEAGADDVIAKPYDSLELEARVEALLLRFQRSSGMTPTSTIGAGLMNQPRRMVAVYSPKGGVGTTTIAVNVAVAHAIARPGRVLIVDLDLQFGQVATHLNVTPRQTIADLARDDQSQREPDLFRTYAASHSSGLDLLAAPGSPELAEVVTPAHVERILQTALLAYDAVVVDAGSVLDERSLMALEGAEVVVLPVYAEISALKAVHSFLDYVNEAGSIGTKTTFVLNSIFAKEVLKMRDVEAGLGAKVSVTLPYDSFVYLKAVNEGNPVVVGAARTTVASSLTSLAALAFGERVSSARPTTEERKSRRLGGLLKRT